VKFDHPSLPCADTDQDAERRNRMFKSLGSLAAKACPIIFASQNCSCGGIPEGAAPKDEKKKGDRGLVPTKIDK